MASAPSTAPPSFPDAARTGTAPVLRGWWAAALGAAVVGIGLTGLQIVEKIAVLSDPGAALVCDVNAVLSCSSVLSAWQSSVLGPPNALIGAVLFAVLGSAALGGVLGGRPARAYLVALWAVAIGFALFATWFMVQTAYAIGALCLWCIGITTAVLVIVAALTRIVVHAHAVSGSLGRGVGALVRSQTDLVVIAGWWLAIAAVLFTGLAM